MFDIGSEYRIVMIEDGGKTSATWKVEECDGSLIKVSSSQGKERIINTSSQVFVSAEKSLRDPEGEERWRQLMPGMPPFDQTKILED